MDALHELRRQLLELHRTLVDSERRDYERSRGRLSDQDFLDALIKDPALAWLGPLTTLIVRLDELLEEEAAEPPTAREALVGEIRQLLRPDPAATGFGRKYDEVMQRSPEVVVAHGRAAGALRQAQERKAAQNI